MIFVVGTGRSGTTTVARLLEDRFGIDMGGPGTFSDAQPKGDYEDPTLRALNWQLVTGEITNAEWKERALEYAATRGEPWGAKHPGFSFLMPILLDAFPDAEIIWAKRDVNLSIASWIRIKGITDPVQLDDVAYGINYRHWQVAYTLQVNRRPHLAIDFTNRLDEDEIAAALGEYLNLEGKQ